MKQRTTEECEEKKAKKRGTKCGKQQRPSSLEKGPSNPPPSPSTTPARPTPRPPRHRDFAVSARIFVLLPVLVSRRRAEMQSIRCDRRNAVYHYLSCLVHRDAHSLPATRLQPFRCCCTAGSAALLLGQPAGGNHSRMGQVSGYGQCVPGGVDLPYVTALRPLATHAPCLFFSLSRLHDFKFADPLHAARLRGRAACFQRGRRQLLHGRGLGSAGCSIGRSGEDQKTGLCTHSTVKIGHTAA